MSRSGTKPAIGITAGCQCGIGPEIVEKAVRDERVLSICVPRVFGAVNHGKRPDAKECGEISMKAVDDAVRAAMTGEIRAMVTAPINKSHWKAAGSPFPGHTEYIAHIAGAKSAGMMMISPRLKVSLVTTHLPLSEVPMHITFDKICEITRLTIEHLKTQMSGRSGARELKIAICALNPHAGDGGTFGKEEDTVIIPSIKALKEEGVNVSGPYPADTVFWKALNGKFDAVIAMYHDQALIPVKTLDFKDTVNVTLGLPFIRTSPDHGTAEDIAGKGTADHHNMIKAIEMAVELALKQEAIDDYHKVRH